MKYLILSLVVIFSLSSCEIAEEIIGEADFETSGGLNEAEIRNGLTQALEVGVNNSVKTASAKNGFYDNNKIRVPFPPKLHKAREAAIDFGLKSQVEKFELKLNRAAEKASAQVKPVFMKALKDMSINDARKILKGDNNAATEYFRRKTYDELKSVCYPHIESVTKDVQLASYWTPIVEIYNKVRVMSGDPEINTDLNEYVTERTIDGLFTLIEKEEKQIRENPEKRVTDLLKKVFANQ